MELLQNGIECAVKYHAGQFRKEHNFAGYRIPFIVHPMQVMKLVFDWGAGSPTNLTSAVCHDILEDTDIDPLVLKQTIGDEAFSIVQELTFYAQKDAINYKSVADLKLEYLATFTTKSVNALVVKLADRYCNIHDFINGGSPDYAKKYRDKAGRLFDAFFDRAQEVANTYGKTTYNIIWNNVHDLLDL